MGLTGNNRPPREQTLGRIMTGLAKEAERLDAEGGYTVTRQLGRRLQSNINVVAGNLSILNFTLEQLAQFVQDHLLNVVSGAVSVNEVTRITFSGATVTDDGDGHVTVTITTSTPSIPTRVWGEEPSSTSDPLKWKFAHTPNASGLALFRSMTRLREGSANDWEFDPLDHTQIVLARALDAGEWLMGDYDYD